MLQLDFLKNLLEYDRYANEKVVAGFQSQQVRDIEAHKLFSHLICAHHIWNARILEKVSNYNVFGLIEPSSYLLEVNANFNTSLKILDERKLEELIGYQNTKGEAFNNSVLDILFHVINHSNYHRAQVATRFRISGYTPVETNYITYKRS